MGRVVAHWHRHFPTPITVIFHEETPRASNVKIDDKGAKVGGHPAATRIRS